MLLEDDEIASITGIAAADRPLWVRLQLGREQSQYFAGLGDKFVQMAPSSVGSAPTVQSDSIQYSSQGKTLIEDGTVLGRHTSIAVEEQLPSRILINSSEALSAVPHSSSKHESAQEHLAESTVPADVNVMCEYCHEVVSSAEQRAEHYRVCSRAQELISAFENVNLNLQSVLMHFFTFLVFSLL